MGSIMVHDRIDIDTCINVANEIIMDHVICKKSSEFLDVNVLVSVLGATMMAIRSPTIDHIAANQSGK